MEPDREESRIESAVMSSRVGLRFKRDTPYDIWKALGPSLAARASASTWWLADWTVFGERNYRRYEEARDATGLDYQTLRNYAVVPRRFPLSRRRDNLSFQHHAEVCALTDEDQDRWLSLAAENRWSMHTLRTRIREAKGVSRAATNHLLRFVDIKHEQRWREAAARTGCSLEDWIIQILDAAVDDAPAGSKRAAP